MKTIRNRIEEILNQVYWRGCTDGNEGAGWKNNIDADDQLLNLMKLEMKKIVKKSNETLKSGYYNDEYCESDDCHFEDGMNVAEAIIEEMKVSIDKIS